MDIQNSVDYWTKSADHDLKTARGLLKIKKYDWCLYIGHLVLEKTLKALYTLKVKESAPKTHNLLYLAEKSGLSLTLDQKQTFEEINNFNLEARYPDYKLNFYKLCTKKFTHKYFAKIEELYIWIKPKLIL